MTTLVIDTSAIIELFVRDVVDPGLRHRVLTGAAAAPELIDLEAANVLRKMVFRKDLPAAEAREALGEICESPVLRVPHRPLVERVWQLRDNLSSYDAAYVALAEVLGVPLVTCDGRLAASGGHGAQIELYARS